MLPPRAFYGQLDSNPDSDSRKNGASFNWNHHPIGRGWIRIQLDSGCLDSDLDLRCLYSHITDSDVSFYLQEFGEVMKDCRLAPSAGIDTETLGETDQKPIDRGWFCFVILFTVEK